MFNPTIKSKTRQYSAGVQSIDPAKSASGLCVSNETKTTIPFQSAQVEKKSSKRMFSLLAVVAAGMLYSSCQKETLSDPALNSVNSDELSASAAGSTGPKVEAGKPKIEVYPSSTSSSLSGSGSSSIGSVSFQWKQVLGNSTALIAQPDKASTGVSRLKPGLYKFVLKVTDKNGNSNTDTTTVSVLEKMKWNVNGTTREALVHPPTGGSGAAPLMFAYHGHGGTDLRFAEKGFEVNWPEAIVVYPQGLPTKANSDRDGKQPGWQRSVGEVNSHTGVKDQDLKFFDVMLSSLKNKYRVNSNLVFAHGWSNGANFVYDALWAERANDLAGIAPACATVNTLKGKKSLPLIHTAGTEDTKCSFNKQQQSVKDIRTMNKCSSTGTRWASGPGGLLGTRYASSIDAPVVFLQYKGPHIYPSTVPPLIVKFFKEVSRQ